MQDLLIQQIELFNWPLNWVNLLFLFTLSTLIQVCLIAALDACSSRIRYWLRLFDVPWARYPCLWYILSLCWFGFLVLIENWWSTSWFQITATLGLLLLFSFSLLFDSPTFNDSIVVTILKMINDCIIKCTMLFELMLIDNAISFVNALIAFHIVLNDWRFGWIFWPDVRLYN